MATTARFRLWRASMIALLLCGSVSAIVDAMGPPGAGQLRGIEFRPTETASQIVVLSVEPESRAATAGILAGDRLMLESSSLFKFQTARAGDVARVRIVDSRRPEEIPLTAAAAQPRTFDVLWAGIRLLTLFVAAIVALSRPDLAPARALAVFLGCIGLLLNWDAYPGALAMVGLGTRHLAMVVGFPQFIVFAATFVGTAPPSNVRRYWGAALALAVAFAVEVLVQQMLYFQNRLVQPVEVAISITILTIFGVGLWVFLAQLRIARGETRERILWVFATMFVSLSGAVVWLFLITRPQPPVWMDGFALTTGLLPVGLSYAILRHRILDISIAINRAIVFATLTAILAPVFGFLEYLVIETVKSLGEGKPTLLEEFFHDPEQRWTAVTYTAFAVFVSMTFGSIHESIDHLCKRLFFKDRAKTIRLLRKAAQDVLFVTDAKKLANHLVAVFDESLRAAGTAIYVREGETFELLSSSISGAPPTVDTNDPVILRLRSSNGIVFLSEMPSAVPGTYALPISSGARLRGVCIIDHGSQGRPFAPEEIQAARAVAHAAGVAIEDIKLRSQGKKISALRAELRTLRSRTPAKEAAGVPISEV